MDIHSTNAANAFFATILANNQSGLIFYILLRAPERCHGSCVCEKALLYKGTV